jgi:serine/threonine protein kinase
MNSILESEPQPLSRYAGDVPPELERIVSKALAKDRERRYQTMKDCAVDLENLRRSLEIESLMRSSQPRRIPSSSGAWDEPPNSGPRISGSSSTPDSRRIPSLPPLPRQRQLLFLLAASIVSGVALFAWAPPALRSIAAFVQSPADVEHQAREQLTRRGISLYGYGSYTDAEGDPKLRQFEQHEKLSDEERRQIESADHEDR